MINPDNPDNPDDIGGGSNWKKVFDFIDNDHSGDVSPSELRTGLRNIGLKYTVLSDAEIHDL